MFHASLLMTFQSLEQPHLESRLVLPSASLLILRELSMPLATSAPPSTNPSLSVRLIRTAQFLTLFLEPSSI
eukprot:CCRYP_013889-RB/>CCRYP_013889-RB protein AED:0.46 eAED:0.46 QI:0/-1/0/1/-1/0/1/0/71